MAEFEIMPANLKSTTMKFDALPGMLSQYNNRVMSVKNNLGFSSELSRVVGGTLQAISGKLSEESKSCGNFARGLSEALRMYKNTEHVICGAENKVNWSGIGGTQSLSGTTGTGTASNDLMDRLSDLLYKPLIAALGPFGTLADIFRRGSEGKSGNVISDILKLAGGFVKNTDGSGVNWGKWFGINVSDKGPWEGAIGKYTDISSGSKAFSTFCNWAAAIVTSGFANYGEFKNFGARFWEETAAETLIKVGEGVLVTAGVSAIAVAAGVSLPALAIGAAAAGVTVLVDWGLDSLVTWATGGSQTSWIEAVSDFVCDTGENIVSGVSDIVHDVGNWVSNTAQDVGNWVSNTAQDVGNWVSDTANSIGETVSNGFSSIGGTIQNIGGSICKWGKLSFGF